ncbi:phage tail tape measure protein, partial [Parabacteroides goldsteinii]
QARNKMNLLAIDLMEKLNPAIIGAMNQTVHWTGKLVTLATWVSENTTEILAVVIGLSAYTVAVKSAIIVDKLQVLWNEKIISSLKTMYATMLKNPYALMGAVVLTWLLYMRKANQELTKMEVVQRRLNKVETEAAQNIAEQKTELEQFLRVARDESESKERRLSALKKINELSPEYLGNLTLEEINTDKATTAINRYIDSIYAMAKAQAAKEQLVEIEKEKIRLDTDPEAFQEQISWLEEMEVGFAGLFSKDKSDRMLADMVARGRERRDKAKELLDAQAEALRGIVMDSSKTINDILADDTSESGGSSKNMKDSEFKAAMDLKLKEMENTHSSELALLKKQKLESEQTEQFYNLQVLSFDAIYYQKRLEQLQDYLKKAGSKKMQAEINKQIVDVQTKQLEIEQKRDKEVIAALQDNRDKQLRIVENGYTQQKTVLEKAVAEQKMTREQADALSLSLDAETAEKRLDIYLAYQNDILSLELNNGPEKAKAIEDANKAVLDADLKASQSRANQQKALQDLLKDFKGQFNLTTVGEDTELQLKVLEDVYNAKKEMAIKDGLDTTELDAAYEKAKTNILQQEEDKRYQIRQQYGLVSLQEEYEKEMQWLQQQRDQELLSLEEFEKAKVQVKIKYLKSSFDYYSDMFSGAVSALQEAELANIDAKYDAEIQRAGDNSEEVARLEKEKENKKLAVQKKYANVQFAIKVSEIIANTAVAIMQAFAQMGPIAGAIAAAVMTTTGAAQIAVANAERKKVMNMTVDGSGSSGGSGTRVATGSSSNAGYYVGGWSGDGSPYEVAGPVHKKEYVVPSFVMSEPAAMNHVVALEAMRRQKTNANPLPGSVVGMATGGYSGNTPKEPDDTSVGIPLSIIKMLVSLLTQLNKGPLKAYVVQSELQAEQDKLNESRKIGSKS